MIVPDVNILVYAFRSDSPEHNDYAVWLDDLVNGDAAFGLSERVLSGLIRIVTHRRIYADPNTIDEVLEFTERLLARENCRPISPTQFHWRLFTRLCRASGAHGNLISDAWFAALAIENGCTWVTADRDFARFPGLTWQHPLDHDAPVTNPA